MISIRSVRSFWLCIFGILFIFLSYVSSIGIQEKQHSDLNLTIRLEARVLEKGSCELILKSSARGSASRSYAPLTLYEYEFAGSKYQGTQVFRAKDMGFNKKNDCMNYLAELNVKNNVFVWIDSSKPDFAVIDPGERSLLFNLSVGIIGLIMVIVFLMLNYRK